LTQIISRRFTIASQVITTNEVYPELQSDPISS
jgi:hypothetical protein